MFIDWSREPFDGGCVYTTDLGFTVVGYYQCPHFEDDCHDWLVETEYHTVRGFHAAEDAMGWVASLIAHGLTHFGPFDDRKHIMAKRSRR